MDASLTNPLLEISGINDWINAHGRHDEIWRKIHLAVTGGRSLRHANERDECACWVEVDLRSEDGSWASGFTVLYCRCG
jgi:hypothetical protein